MTSTHPSIVSFTEIIAADLRRTATLRSLRADEQRLALVKWEFQYGDRRGERAAIVERWPRGFGYMSADEYTVERQSMAESARLRLAGWTPHCDLDESVLAPTPESLSYWGCYCTTSFGRSFVSMQQALADGDEARAIDAAQHGIVQVLRAALREQRLDGPWLDEVQRMADEMGVQGGPVCYQSTP